MSYNLGKISDWANRGLHLLIMGCIDHNIDNLLMLNAGNGISKINEYWKYLFQFMQKRFLGINGFEVTLTSASVHI